MKLKRKELQEEEYVQDDDLLNRLTDDDNNEDINDNSINGIDDFDPGNLGDDFNGPGIAPYEKHNDILKNIMDFDSYIKQLVNGWLGLIWNEEQSRFIKDPHKQPIMNSQCAAWCGSTLRTYARANNVITTINEDIYNEIMTDVGRNIIINIRSRSNEFGIKNQGDAGSIIVQMINTVKLMLSGLGNGKMSRVLTDTVSRNESVVVSENNRQQQNNNQNHTPQLKGGFSFINKLMNN